MYCCSAAVVTTAVRCRLSMLRARYGGTAAVTLRRQRFGAFVFGGCFDIIRASPRDLALD